ncbi:MAG: M20/M25/M40 family metallo-hydrolase [Dehalococcoidia bacterium]|nr:MAG: M20/M25/M40 family metallo-hydrolase [Dehalococcoidia bacterium]
MILGCLALTACQATEPSTEPSATASPTAALSWSSVASLVSGDQAYLHVLALAEDIGTRPVGSDAERQAAQYLSQQFTTYGYQTKEQQFTVEYYVETAALEVLTPTPLSLNPLPLRLSGSGEVTAELVPADLGRLQDFPPEGLKDRIALIERGDLSFSDKVTNAAAAGAAAVVIYNNAEGPFRGDLREESPIPALSLSQAEGHQLQALLAEGPLTVRLSVQSTQETKPSQNVIARPSQNDCELIVGAHYDSVAAAPGANDNASGSAILLEIARVLDLADQEEGVCFVAFGAEETTLSGSRHFVATLTSQAQPSPQAMVNLDMVGVGTEWQLMGSPSLVEKIDQEATALGLDPVPTDPHLSGDHISFMDAGIPAIFIHRFEDPHYHTELDRAEFVEPQLLKEAAKLTLLALAALASP